MSVENLIEHTNLFDDGHHPSLQIFCGMYLGYLELIRNTEMMSRVRDFITHNAGLERVQRSLIDQCQGI